MSDKTPSIPMPDKAADAKKLHAAVKETWSRLSDEDIKLCSTNREQFFATVKDKQGIARVDAEKALRDMEKTCGCSSSSEKPASSCAA